MDTWDMALIMLFFIITGTAIIDKIDEKTQQCVQIDLAGFHCSTVDARNNLCTAFVKDK